MKAKKCASIFFVLMFILNGIVINKVGSQYADNTIFIDPPSIVDTSMTKGKTTTVGINISYVERLHSWQVKLRYNPALLYTNQSLINEGPFLKTGGAAVPRSTTFHMYLDADYVFIACSISSRDWVDGGSGAPYNYGYLATITFVILRSGETRLEILSDPSDLQKTKLLDVNGNTIPHTSQDGYFRNIAAGLTPKASFFHSPTYPLWYENTTFDGSASSGSLGIARYLWFFGDTDTSSGRENTANETDPVTYHEYIRTGLELEKNFTVRLIVVDNTGATGNLSVRMVTVVSSRVLHNLAIVYPYVSVNSTNVEPAGSFAITMYVENQGNSSETFNATTYYKRIGVGNWTAIDTQKNVTLNASEMRPLKFIWHLTTGVSSGVYAINATVSPVTGETNISDNTYIFGNVTVTFAPHASFSYEPANPYVDEVIVFNASASSDPDGTITGYSWDFGEWILDGLSRPWTQVSIPLIEHTYAVGSTYFVTLRVTDDLGATASISQWVKVSGLPSVVSLTVPPIATVGSNSIVNGSVSPVPLSAKVGIFNRRLGEGVWNSLVNTTTDADGEFSYVWTPTAPGTFEFKANWTGDQRYAGDESDVLVVVVRLRSNVSLSVTPSHVTLGENVTIRGSISPSRGEATVTILFRVGGGPWNPIGNAVTDQNGSYTYSWKPSTVGDYEIKALWAGDEITFGADSYVVRVNVAGAFNYFLYLAVAAVVAFVVVAVLLLRFRKKR